MQLVRIARSATVQILNMKWDFLVTINSTCNTFNIVNKAAASRTCSCSTTLITIKRRRVCFWMGDISRYYLIANTYIQCIITNTYKSNAPDLNWHRSWLVGTGIQVNCVVLGTQLILLCCFQRTHIVWKFCAWPQNMKTCLIEAELARVSHFLKGLIDAAAVDTKINILVLCGFRVSIVTATFLTVPNTMLFHTDARYI